jgi:hypothetical protein
MSVHSKRRWDSLRWGGLILVVVGALGGCATLQEIAALRQVAFSLDRVSDVRVAGVALGNRDSYADFSVSEIARIAAAVSNRNVPLGMIVHVEAQNPPDNNVTARMMELDWTLFIEDRKTVDGKLPGTYLLPPGEPVDIPVGVELDMMDFFGGGARELVNLALAVGGQGTAEVRLEARPTIETSLGPIRYPAPIVIRRQVRGSGS